MKEKDVFAVMGLLMGGVECYSYDDADSIYFDFSKHYWLVASYLKKLKRSFGFIKHLLMDNYYGERFYHMEIGENSIHIPAKLLHDKEKLFCSNFDFVIIDSKTGRIGVWCEIDGFIAWLDEYKKVWVLDSREKVLERERKAQEAMKEFLEPIFKKAFENFEKETGLKTVKVKRIYTKGIESYKKK